jgi:hypothetical protein
VSIWWFVPSTLLVIQLARYLTRQRNPRWQDPRPTRSAAPTDVHLIAGPWPDQTVVVTEALAVGDVLSSESWGLGDGESHHGDYVITSVHPDSPQAVATWRHRERSD